MRNLFRWTRPFMAACCALALGGLNAPPVTAEPEATEPQATEPPAASEVAAELALVGPDAAASASVALSEGGLDLDAGGSFALRPGFGVRIGGYGFRAVTENGDTTWFDCRMDGFGAFATLGIGDLMFGEVGVDAYQSTGGAFEESGMERLDLSVQAAFGVKPFPGAVVRPFAQLGVGAAYVDVSFTNGPEDIYGIYPMGFVGTGGEVAIGDHVKLGLNLRLYVLATIGDHLEVSRSETDGQIHVAAPLEPGLAGQGQLFARFDI